MKQTLLLTCSFAWLLGIHAYAEENLDVKLRYQNETKPDSKEFVTQFREEKWEPQQTALIICDVWDYHHCLNVVRRVGEFGPRLNDVVTAARKRGVTIIHAPSDCMDAYQDHPARRRAIETPLAAILPNEIKSWCSLLPSEERAVYPIDQSDGGEDDDPQEHAEWARKLESLGRNPAQPWKAQSELIAIDGKTDYISDRGDEVWSILEQRGIRNVILTGVHTNMCVLGRPFGLRQMARNGKNVVLMRDMTDTMYNPQRWPFVSHFEGTRRIIAHIERYVCPTITSDQFIGGKPFRFKGDRQAVDTSDGSENVGALENYQRYWSPRQVPGPLPESLRKYAGGAWYRCVVRIPSDWADDSLSLRVDRAKLRNVWCNGRQLASADGHSWKIPASVIVGDDANLLVVKIVNKGLDQAPVLQSGNRQLKLEGRWQLRIGDDPELADMPLPAKFGTPTDIVFAPPEPLWTPRPLTKPGEFTAGIEGPACDREGNVFAVNYEKQGTIGRVRPDGVGEVFLTLPDKSVGNGIRFDRSGHFYVADYPRHNVLKVELASRQLAVLAHHDEMNQPNDLAIAPDGTLYASDPNWSDGTGQLWRIDPDGTTTRLAREMGTTNGIEVSPDGSTLYVNESKQRNLWAFDITADRTLAKQRLIRKFKDHGFDGMRCDVDGNLYVTRYGKGTVVKLSPKGQTLREIPVLGSRPSNICFGGPDGCTAYVTEVEFTRLVTFRVDRPGRSWQEQREH